MRAGCGVIERNGPDTPPTQRIDRGVMRDPQDPGGQAPAHVERGETADGFDEGFLGEILRQRAIAGQANEQRQDRALVTTDDLLDRRLRAAKRLGYQPCLGNAIRIDQDRPVLATTRISMLTQGRPRSLQALPVPGTGTCNL